MRHWILVALGLACCVALLPLAAQMLGGSRRPTRSRPLPAGMAAARVDFQDVAAAAGLTGINVSGSDVQQHYIIENTGTGVAVFDFDNDGLPDLFFVNGDRFENRGHWPGHHLYRNLGHLKFEEVTARSGITHEDWGQGVCAGDMDNDGRIDLYVTAWGRNHLWHNRGDGTFEDQTAARGLDAPARWSTGCAFLDYDRDGHLDLFVAHYLRFDPSKTAKPGDPGACIWKGFPVVCGPMGLPPETMSLYRNDGHGHFAEVTHAAGIDAAKAAGLSVLVSDFDNDGWPDVYVTGDSTPSLYFRNRRDGTFEDQSLASGAGLDENGREQSGMGATAADYNHTGMLSIAKTNFSDDMPDLYRNLGNHTFIESAASAGLAIYTQYVGWGLTFLDVDNDGWKDLLIANGHVYPDIDGRLIGQTYRQQRLLFWNRRDGQFFDMSATAGPGITTLHSSRGIATADFDNDGSLEVAVVNLHTTPSLLKNMAPQGNAVLVRAQLANGRDAIGTRITVEAGGMTQFDDIRSGGTYASQSDFRVHFGLAQAAQCKVTVRWPGGVSQSFNDVAANSLVTLREGRGLVSAAPLTERR